MKLSFQLLQNGDDCKVAVKNNYSSLQVAANGNDNYYQLQAGYKKSRKLTA